MKELFSTVVSLEHILTIDADNLDQFRMLTKDNGEWWPDVWSQLVIIAWNHYNTWVYKASGNSVHHPKYQEYQKARATTKVTYEWDTEENGLRLTIWDEPASHAIPDAADFRKRHTEIMKEMGLAKTVITIPDEQLAEFNQLLYSGICAHTEKSEWSSVRRVVIDNALKWIADSSEYAKQLDPRKVE